MDILFDHQIFSYQKYGGISRIYSELIQRFARLDSVNCDLGVIDTQNTYLLENGEISLTPMLSRLSLKRNIPLYCVNAAYSRKKMVSNNYEIIHPTYYNPYFLPYLRKRPFVITVYDMIHEIYPESVSKRDYASKWKKKVIPKAKRIITISENTKNDLLKYYDISPEKIEVIYLANSLRMNFEKPNFNLPNSYILYVGSRDRHKNFSTFLRALKDVCAYRKELHIVCVGGPSFTKVEMQLIFQYHLTEKIHLMHLSDSELGYVYANAELFVFPSLYEGFGIPILEAFCMGCPVILSNTSCFPEIAGEAGQYFDPENHSSLRKSIETVLADEEYKNYLIKKGFNQGNKYSWDICANQTLHLYEGMLRN